MSELPLPIAGLENGAAESTGGDGATDALRTLPFGKPDRAHRARQDGIDQLGSSVELTFDGNGSIFGNYELLEEVGRGGMGVIYKARHRSLDRIVALKINRTASMESMDGALRFQVEAAAVAKLDHPGIVPIFDIGCVRGQQYFSMAFVEGESLAAAIKLGPLTSRRAAEVVHVIADAVAYAHGQGIIHRDIKPENILLDTAGRPRITDFGIAKFVNHETQLTHVGEAIGTPSYMPPEQARGQMDQVGPLADVYSLGATLYSLLTGRPPFQAASAFDTFKQVIELETGLAEVAQFDGRPRSRNDLFEVPGKAPGKKISFRGVRRRRLAKVPESTDH